MVSSINNVAVRWHGAGGLPTQLLSKLDMEELVDKWPARTVRLGEPIGNGLTER